MQPIIRLGAVVLIMSVANCTLRLTITLVYWVIYVYMDLAIHVTTNSYLQHLTTTLLVPNSCTKKIYFYFKSKFHTLKQINSSTISQRIDSTHDIPTVCVTSD